MHNGILILNNLPEIALKRIKTAIIFMLKKTSFCSKHKITLRFSIYQGFIWNELYGKYE